MAFLRRGPFAVFLVLGMTHSAFAQQEFRKRSLWEVLGVDSELTKKPAPEEGVPTVTSDPSLPPADLVTSPAAAPASAEAPLPTAAAELTDPNLKKLDAIWKRMDNRWKALHELTVKNGDQAVDVGWQTAPSNFDRTLDPSELASDATRGPGLAHIRSAMEDRWEPLIRTLKFSPKYSVYKKQIDELNQDIAEYRRTFQQTQWNPSIAALTSPEVKAPAKVVAKPAAKKAPEKKIVAKVAAEATHSAPAVAPQVVTAQPEAPKVAPPAAARPLVKTAPAHKAESHVVAKKKIATAPKISKPEALVEEQAEALAMSFMDAPKAEATSAAIGTKPAADVHTNDAAAVKTLESVADAGILQSPPKLDKMLMAQDIEAHKMASELAQKTKIGIYRGKGPKGEVCTAIVRDRGKMYFKENEPGFEISLILGSVANPYAGLKTGNYAHVSWGQSPEIGGDRDDIPANPTASELRQASKNGDTLPLPVLRERNLDKAGQASFVIDRLGYRFEDQRLPTKGKVTLPSRDRGRKDPHEIVRETATDTPLHLQEVRQQLNMEYKKGSNLLDEITVVTQSSNDAFERKQIRTDGDIDYFTKEAYRDWKTNKPKKDKFRLESKIKCTDLEFVSDLPGTPKLETKARPIFKQQHREQQAAPKPEEGIHYSDVVPPSGP